MVREKHIANNREVYDLYELNIEDIQGKDPMSVLKTWVEFAMENNALEPTAFSMATSSISGDPNVRTVLLKDFWEGKPVFYTNYHSQKGQEIKANPKVGVNFFWPQLQRQVRIKGTVIKVPTELSDAYFASRPLQSQAGAAASPQSQVIDGKEALLNKELELLNQKIITRPANWGGYAIDANYVEFWQGRPSRLHDRVVVEKVNGSWDKAKRLAP
jgi:pyridoxamine 5'-phosphate oxidase